MQHVSSSILCNMSPPLYYATCLLLYIMQHVSSSILCNMSPPLYYATCLLLYILQHVSSLKDCKRNSEWRIFYTCHWTYPKISSKKKYYKSGNQCEYDIGFAQCARTFYSSLENCEQRLDISGEWGGRTHISHPLICNYFVKTK